MYDSISISYYLPLSFIPLDPHSIRVSTLFSILISISFRLIPTTQGRTKGITSNMILIYPQATVLIDLVRNDDSPIHEF